MILWNDLFERERIEQLSLVMIQPSHHRPPPQRIASEQANHRSRKPSTPFATKSARSCREQSQQREALLFDHLVGRDCWLHSCAVAGKATSFCGVLGQSAGSVVPSGGLHEAASSLDGVARKLVCRGIRADIARLGNCTRRKAAGWNDCPYGPWRCG